MINTKNYYWVTQEGLKIKVREMTESHVENSLKYMERRGKKGSESYNVLKAEQRRRKALVFDKEFQEILK